MIIIFIGLAIWVGWSLCKSSEKKKREEHVRQLNLAALQEYLKR